MGWNASARLESSVTGSFRRLPKSARATCSWCRWYDDWPAVWGRSGSRCSFTAMQFDATMAPVASFGPIVGAVDHGKNRLIVQKWVVLCASSRRAGRLRGFRQQHDSRIGRSERNARRCSSAAIIASKAAKTATPQSGQRLQQFLPDGRRLELQTRFVLQIGGGCATAHPCGDGIVQQDWGEQCEPVAAVCLACRLACPSSPIVEPLSTAWSAARTTSAALSLTAEASPASSPGAALGRKSRVSRRSSSGRATFGIG